MRASYANVMATVAVFLALGGASYAAVSLPRGSVGSEQLREHAVTHSKLSGDSVGTRQLRAESVEPSKLADEGVTKRSLSSWIRGQLARRAEDGAAGQRGEQGPRGAEGPQGPQGPGAVPVRYSAAASTTPDPVTALDVGGLTMSASCDDSGSGITLNFTARSAEAATLNETVTADSGSDLSTPAPADFTGNLQIDLPAGVTLQPGGPAAASGYSRVAVEAVYSSPSRTIELRIFATVDADAGRCTVNGIAVPT